MRARSGSSNGTVDAGLRADVVDDPARDRDAHALLDQERLGAELNGVVFPEAGLPGLVLRRRRPLGLDRPDRVAFLFEQVELAGDPQSLGRQRNAPGAQRVSLLARAVGQVGVVDPSVLEQAVLDELVDRHHRLDVFEVIEPGAIADLVQGTDRDQVGLVGVHSRTCAWLWSVAIADGIGSGGSAIIGENPLTLLMVDLGKA